VSVTRRQHGTSSLVSFTGTCQYGRYVAAVESTVRSLVQDILVLKFGFLNTLYLFVYFFS
jgi:hypothetical protein